MLKQDTKGKSLGINLEQTALQCACSPEKVKWVGCLPKTGEVWENHPFHLEMTLSPWE